MLRSCSEQVNGTTSGECMLVLIIELVFVREFSKAPCKGPFEFGLKGVHRWHSSVDYILEKGKDPVLGKLRTIKLLECDLNFGLKLAFAWGFGI